MARTKQTKKVKPPWLSPPRKSINQSIVKSKKKRISEKIQNRLASSHKNQKIGLFTAEDMEAAVSMYRRIKTPWGGPKLSIRAVAAKFAHKHITFGSLQKKLSGEAQTMGPSSGGKGRPRVLPRDVEGNFFFNLFIGKNWICVFLCQKMH